MQFGRTAIVDEAVELELDVKMSVAAGGGSTHNSVEVQLEHLHLECAAHPTLIARFEEAVAGDRANDSTSRSRPLSEEPRRNS
jgi:hypothetical protein